MGDDDVEHDDLSQRDRMLSGELYRADDPDLVADRRRAQELLDAFNSSRADDVAGRRRMLALLLGAVGDGTEVVPPLHCDYGSQVRIGARTFVNVGLTVLDPAAVVIGDDVQIGPHVQLLTATHPLEAERRREGWESAAPITIGSNVWLGGGVIVLPGVTIGEDTVVGAGSVVTKDLPVGVVAVGNPARVVRRT